MATTTHTYTTEDGATVRTGDRVYNYYDMVPGIIEDDRGNGWFRFVADTDRQACMLNGPRICTIAFAKRRGFRGV